MDPGVELFVLVWKVPPVVQELGGVGSQVVTKVEREFTRPIEILIWPGAGRAQHRKDGTCL